MSETKVEPQSCDHQPSESICEACAVLRRHSSSNHLLGESGRCDCAICSAIRWSNEQEHGEREQSLRGWAEGFFYDLLGMWFAGGMDATAVLVALREFEYPPNYSSSGGDFFAWEGHQTVLRTMRYEDYLRSPEWAEQRRRALVRASGRCQGCNGTKRQTHHRTYERRGIEEPADLTVLCSACHTAVHLVMDARQGKVRPTSRRNVVVTP